MTRPPSASAALALALLLALAAVATTAATAAAARSSRDASRGLAWISLASSSCRRPKPPPPASSPPPSPMQLRATAVRRRGGLPILWAQHRGSSGSQRRPRRDEKEKRGGGGGGGGKRGGGGGKGEDEEGEDYRSMLPAPAAEESEEEAAGKPADWPAKVVFSQKLKWSGGSGLRAGAGEEVKEAFRRRLLPGIQVRRIEDPGHVLSGQFGVYATRHFNPFDVVGEYVGRVVPPSVGGEYVATIDWEDRRFEDGTGRMWGVDSGEYGNEVRMINHFHGIAPVPNIKLVTAYVAEFPHILAVVIRPIPVGAELLLDYGPNYWCSASHPAPPEPPGIDDPPE